MRQWGLCVDRVVIVTRASGQHKTVLSAIREDAPARGDTLIGTSI